MPATTDHRRKTPKVAAASLVGAHPTKRRSNLPRRRRRDPTFSTADVPDLDSELESSPCLKSVVTLESKSSKRPATAIDGDVQRPITRWYNRRRKPISGERDPKRSKIDVGAKAEAVASTGISVSCVDTVSDAHGGRNPRSKLKDEMRPQVSESSVVERRDRGLDLASSEIISVADYEDEKTTVKDECNGGEEDEGSAYSSCDEITLSQYEAELFSSYRSSGGDYSSSYYSSSLFDSSSGASFSGDGEGAPSATFTLLRRLAEEFVPSEFSVEPGIQREFSMEFAKMRFEDEDDEESYLLFRNRERKEAMVHDYAAEYGDKTDYGGLILDQRLVMVQWMIEHSSAMELQCETLFLGVSLLDRFLSRGYFKNERNLQLLGIACITLATRIEENQPYNSIRQIAFKVGSNYYRKSEVVAMEWLVQKVLKFKCFVPTTHNFLWFYLKAAQADACVQTLSRYLAVLSLLDHERLSFFPSSIAAGLVILACLASNCDDSSQLVMETHVRSKSDDLPECMQSLQWLVKYAC